MAQMQNLGTIPERKSPLADAIKAGIEGYMYGQQQAQQRQQKQQEIGLKQQELGIQQQKVTADITQSGLTQKKEAMQGVMEAIKLMNPQAAETFLANPEVQKAFTDVGMPIPYGASNKPMVDINLSQAEQEADLYKKTYGEVPAAGARRGKGLFGTSFMAGQPSQQAIQKEMGKVKPLKINKITKVKD